MVHELILSLGSNLGERKAYLERAVVLINEKVGRVVACSSFLETEPWGFQSDHKFLNLALIVATHLRVEEVLSVTQSIEKELGRTLKSIDGYADRVIDIDLLFYDNDIVRTEDLTLPHPFLHQRDFVLKPLMELSPNKLHPLLGKTIQELFSELSANN